ncbi:MAG: PIN domain-containing protein [Candidatus Aminicenantes bacterium]|nr:PIN domain-containing protein [Candidatus Aminicenantes bacterium]
MNVFVDTSALLAVLDRRDGRHESAKRTWIELLEAGRLLVCHNYILVETSAVLARRMGMEAARLFVRDVVPALRVVWITRDIHEAAVGAQLAAGRRALSLVDCASFEIMRRAGLRAVFAFDPHFEEFGYEPVG